MSEVLCDIAAERAVLAGIYQFGQEAYIDVAGIISANTFTFESNQIVFKCLEHLLKEKTGAVIDMPSVWSAATDLGFKEILTKPDERNYLRSLSNLPVRKENVHRLAGKIGKLEVVRSLRKKLKEVDSELLTFTGDEPVNKILSVPETAILDFSSSLDSHDEAGMMGDGIMDYINYLIENPREKVGIGTGWKYYDRLVGNGLLPGVNIVGARPKVGKTTFADNVGLYISGVLGVPVLNLDSEMTKKNHWDRILANLSSVDVQLIRTGEFGRNHYMRRKVQEAGQMLEMMPYSYESVIGQDMDACIAIARRWLMKKVGFQENGLANPCVIIYDYLKLASEESLGRDLKEYQALGFQINSLHNFVAKYEIPCLAMIQLNRDGMTREDSSVMSGSDRQAWACTSFCLFKKKSPEEINEDGGKKYNRKLVQIMARFAPEWEEENYINLRMEGQFAKIIEGETRHELHKSRTQGELLDDASKIPSEDKQF